LFYPENQDLARRCQELVDDIVNIQSSVAGKQSDNNTMDADLTKLVNQVMTAHGYKSYTDLQNAVLASLTPDQRQKIEDSMKAAQKLNNGLDITFQVCMLLTTTAAVIGLGE
jgi:Spy/CpxP family protein refolding chaperone